MARAIKDVPSRHPTPKDHERLTKLLLLGPTKTHAKRKLTVPEPIAVELSAVSDPSRRFIFMTEKGEPVRHNSWYKHVFTPAARVATPEWIPAAEARTIQRFAEEAREPPTRAQLDRVSPFRFHDLRHTCASILVDEGRKQQHSRDIIAFDIMRYLGHKDIQTTLNIYAHWLAGAQEALAASLAARYRAAQQPEPAKARSVRSG